VLLIACGSCSREHDGHSESTLSTEFSLGPARIGQEIEGSLSISNPGSTPIEIDRFETTCGCIELDPSSLRLKAGQSAVVTVTIAPRDRHGRYDVGITGRSKSNVPLFGLSITHDVLPPLGEPTRATAHSTIIPLTLPYAGWLGEAKAFEVPSDEEFPVLVDVSASVLTVMHGPSTAEVDVVMSGVGVPSRIVHRFSVPPVFASKNTETIGFADEPLK